MPLSRSAHVDTFTRDRLPPQEQWPELRFDLPELDYPDRLNCAVRLLDETIERIGPDQRCLVTDTEEWTYGWLLERANQVADVLSTQLGLVPGNRVLLRAPNNPWLVATWLGVLKAGGVVVLTMPLLRPAELVTTIELTLPSLAICDHRFLADLHTARDEAAPAMPVVAFGGVDPDDLLNRAGTLPIEKASPDELADAVARHGVTALFTAPTAYKAMVAAGKGAQLRSVRRAVSAGEHLPEATWRAFYEATDVRIIDGIGSTEMLHIFVASAGDEIRPGSTGRAVPGYEATVLDEDGNEAPPGVQGRLAVRGPTGCRYLADERQQVYVQDGWNVTGDTYVRDEDGYFWYQARNDDMIITSGYNIAGPEVEEAL